MRRRFRHRPVLLRAFWLALMAVAFVWQPALLAAAEAHERIHLLAAGEHTHGGHDDHRADAHAGPSDGPAPANADAGRADHHDLDPGLAADHGDAPEESAPPRSGLHALLHAMHCCGHPTALPTLLLSVLAPAPALTPPVTAHSGRPGPQLADPLRPPIVG